MRIASPDGISAKNIFLHPLTNGGTICIIIYVADNEATPQMESWLSGLRRTTGNRVWAYTPPRVQIPNSPPKKPVLMHGFFVVLRQGRNGTALRDKPVRHPKGRCAACGVPGAHAGRRAALQHAAAPERRCKLLAYHTGGS